MIDSREYEHDIPEFVAKKVHEMADKNSDGKLDLEEFVHMIHHPGLAPLFGHYVNRLVLFNTKNKKAKYGRLGGLVDLDRNESTGLLGW